MNDFRRQGLFLALGKLGQELYRCLRKGGKAYFETKNEIFDQLVTHDETVLTMKKEVITWMITLEEADRRSSMSQSSRRTELSNSSVLSGGRKPRKPKDKPNEEEMKVQLDEEKMKLEHHWLYEYKHVAKGNEDFGSHPS